LFGHRFGAFHAPCGSSLFCFGCAALRVTVSLQILFGKNAEKISPEPPQMQSFGTWEHGPLALWCPDQDREIQQTETIMYQNKVTLIGFLGSNAEARTNSPDFSVTTLSLATKSSYKKDGKYISHTEWHRCVVFGKLSEFAKTLTKGAHIQVEGELRSREYDSKKTDSKRRVWEIRVASILKLDRAEKPPRTIKRKIRSTRMRPRRKRPHKPLLFTLGSLANRWASIAVRFPL
jgi:single-strand DNA-binding protein